MIMTGLASGVGGGENKWAAAEFGRVKDETIYQIAGDPSSGRAIPS